MRLTSPAFRDGDEIPQKYTSDGANISPPLAWTDVPPGTRSLALIVDDPDAPDPDAPATTWVHWVVFDMPPSRKNLHEDVGALPDGHVGINDWKRAAWGGPSPPIGRHRYFFKLYALDRTLELSRPTKAELERAMAGHILADATLIGTYKKARH
ncbi:MAG: YbhB/YbcL family Raf kinase inhibitor-like protein [Kofleriaceae bacterium]